jgi:hypothetical protein
MPLYQSSVASIITYVEFTADVTINTTVESSAVTIVTAAAFTPNGTDSFMIEFFCPQYQPGTSASEYMAATLWDGSTDLGWIGVMLGGTGALFSAQVMRRKVTPTSAAHTYSIRGHNSAAGNGIVHAGAGTPGLLLPGYIRISKEF